ncbi:hypothetical protein [Anaerorhabdus sp.]|uniref:hypothetical protein n=1 Tax=Anaerorhabdus sp. TaxID=1872524 RepID=UPI002FC77DDF
MDWMIFTGFCGVLFAIFLYKSIAVYKIYNNTFYEDLYSNFLEFYIKFKYKKNLSQSSWLKQELGTHRILFNSYLNEDKKIQYSFVTIFSSYGIQIFCINNIHGNISGSMNDAYWKNDKSTSSTRFLNPTKACDTHKKYIEDLVIGNMSITTFILFPNDSNVSKIKSNYSTCLYKEFIQLIKNSNASISNEVILSEFQKCIGR